MNPLESGVVGTILTWPAVIDQVQATGFTPSMLSDPDLSRLYAHALAAHQRGERPDIDLIGLQAAVGAELVAQTTMSALSISGAVQAARGLVETRVRLRFADDLSSVLAAAADGMPLSTLLSLVDEATLATAHVLPDDARWLDEALDENDSYDWVVEGFLERGNRMLVTADEGAGKTELLIQLAIQAAAGVHPWTLRRVPPASVLFVDLELGERDVARRLRRIAQNAPTMDRKRLRWVCRPEGMNLLAGDAAWLAAQLADHPADLLVIGPLYNAYAGVAERGDIGGEDMARRLVRALNRLKEKFGLALIMETHAPHASGGSKRDLRPFGSSLYVRWPDFGIGLRRDDDDPNRYLLNHWRGPRGKRLWPTALDRQEPGWPWVAFFANGDLNDERNF